MAEVRFFIGVKEISQFLGLHPNTTQKKLNRGLIPAKKDPLGRWVLTDLDYYKSLKAGKAFAEQFIIWSS
jgi:hypothetical protein